ncbi:hypothetical protein [Rhizobium leguminosarum]|uniref:Uncharacterized protein n=1 Tax=Rhizobium leguminosarum TaxID=384 RepID=A0A1B1CKD4_RHILE|nr:hypothetical protein [Rhizobium leguminosarum]ANP90217.1 hypothetical protein BA011_40600 [Rhizobium leguminosarum]
MQLIEMIARSIERGFFERHAKLRHAAVKPLDAIHPQTSAGCENIRDGIARFPTAPNIVKIRCKTPKFLIYFDAGCVDRDG